MSVMCLSDGSHWPATTAEYQKKKKLYFKCNHGLRQKGQRCTERDHAVYCTSVSSAAGTAVCHAVYWCCLSQHHFCFTLSLICCCSWCTHTDQHINYWVVEMLTINGIMHVPATTMSLTTTLNSSASTSLFQVPQFYILTHDLLSRGKYSSRFLTSSMWIISCHTPVW